MQTQLDQYTVFGVSDINLSTHDALNNEKYLHINFACSDHMYIPSTQHSDTVCTHY